MMVAMRTLRLIVALVSCGLMTHSERLQKPLGLRVISPHGFVPNSMPSHLRLPVRFAELVAAMRLKMPRSPDFDSMRVRNSLMKISGSGFSVYATELFASLRHGAPDGLVASHHWPFFALRMRSSDKLERESMAERRTPPTTTTSPIMHIMSWHSIEFSLRPAAFLKSSTVKRKRRSSGSGPDARPPIVFNNAPFGRIALKSHEGMSPL